jgi:hypothetical protein
MSCLVNPHRYDAGAGGGGLSSKWRLNISAKKAGANWTSIAELEMRGSVGGFNLCAGGTASASASNGANPASSAFDGNSATSWQSGTATSPQWIEYDFASAVTIEQVALKPTAITGDTPTQFTVEYWDGSAWQIYWHVGDVPMNVQNSNQLIFTRPNSGAAGTSTEWRLNITASRTGTGFPSISELELRATSGGSDLTISDSSDGSSTFSNHSTAGNDATKAFDNSTSSRWQGTAAPSGGSPQIIGFRFTAPRAITEISVTNYTTLGDSPKTFDIQYWNEGTAAWVTSWSVADSAFSSTTQTLVFH